MRFVLFLLVLPLLFAACYSPSLKSGDLRCAGGDHPCPDGFYCAAVTHSCWRNGTQPPAFGAIWTSSGGGASDLDGGAKIGVTIGGQPYGFFSDQAQP